jgi:hypothetical protein
MVYGLSALNLAVLAIPLLFIIWRVLKAPIRLRTSDLALLVFLGVWAVIYGVCSLTGPYIFILAGAR